MLLYSVGACATIEYKGECFRRRLREYLLYKNSSSLDGDFNIRGLLKFACMLFDYLFIDKYVKKIISK